MMIRPRNVACAVALTWAVSSSVVVDVGAFSPGRAAPRSGVAARSSYFVEEKSMSGASTATALFAFDVEERTSVADDSDDGVPKNNGAQKPSPPAGEETLSDVDARVLRSILEEGKVDAKTEEGLKKMLERGTAPKQAQQPGVAKTKKEEEEGEFSSTFFKAVSDNAFWNSLKAKTAELVDSAKIFIANRVERDSKLLASVGLFAWERAKRDVERALPASGTTGAAVGRAVRTAGRLLAPNSSFVEYVPDDNFVLPPSKYGEGAGEAGPSVREQLNTPMDEIRSVTESIRDILAGKGQPNLADGGGGGGGRAAGGAEGPRRGLRSVAPAGTANIAERQRRAFDRRRRTVLEREKEGIDRKFGRAVGAATDAAYELKRDMSVETNRPGYKAREVRRSIEASAVGQALLGAGKKAEALPEGKEGGAFGRFFGRSKDEKDVASEKSLQLEGSTSAAEDVDAAPVDTEVEVQAKKSPMDATAAAFDSYYREAAAPVAAETVDAEALAVDNDSRLDADIDDAILTDGSYLDFDIDLDDIEIDADSIAVELPPEPIPPLPPLIIEDMAYERARLAAVLRACLEAPERTWLVPDVIPPNSPDASEGGGDDTAAAVFSVADVDALKEVITSMVFARDDLEVLAEDDGPQDPSMDAMLKELRMMKGTTDSIASLAVGAAGIGAAERLKAQLVGEIDLGWEEEGGGGGYDESSLLAGLDDLAERVGSYDEDVARYEARFSAWEIECESLRGTAIEAARSEARAEAAARAEERRRAKAEAEAKRRAEEEAAIREAEAARASSAAVAAEVVDADEKRGGRRGFGGPFGMFADAFVDLDLNGAEPVNGAGAEPTKPPQQDASKTVKAVTAEVVDTQVTRVEMYEDRFGDFARPAQTGSMADPTDSGSSTVVEVVSDEEFNTAFGGDGNSDGSGGSATPREAEMKTAVAAEEEKEKGEDPLVFRVLLRTLDVVFFVTEKTITVGLPAIFGASKTVSVRLNEIQKEGMGSEGWERLHNVKDGAKRY